MIKRLFYAMAAIAVIVSTTACQKEKQRIGTEYEITLQVSMNGEVVYEEKDVTWNLAYNKEDNTYTLIMNRTRFIEAMPYLDMEVRGMNNMSTFPLDAFVFNADSIVPYYNGEPMPRYEMTDFYCKIDIFGAGETTFTCVGFQVRYSVIAHDIYE